MWFFRRMPKRTAEPLCSIIRTSHIPHADSIDCIVSVDCRCGKTHRYRIHNAKELPSPQAD